MTAETTINKKFLEVRYNETFFQKGFWPPEATRQLVRDAALTQLPHFRE